MIPSRVSLTQSKLTDWDSPSSHTGTVKRRPSSLESPKSSLAPIHFDIDININLTNNLGAAAGDNLTRHAEIHDSTLQLPQEIAQGNCLASERENGNVTLTESNQSSASCKIKGTIFRDLCTPAKTTTQSQNHIDQKQSDTTTSALTTKTKKIDESPSPQVVQTPAIQKKTKLKIPKSISSLQKQATNLLSSKKQIDNDNRIISNNSHQQTLNPKSSNSSSGKTKNNKPVTIGTPHASPIASTTTTTSSSASPIIASTLSQQNNSVGDVKGKQQEVKTNPTSGGIKLTRKVSFIPSFSKNTSKSSSAAIHHHSHSSGINADEVIYKELYRDFPQECKSTGGKKFPPPYREPPAPPSSVQSSLVTPVTAHSHPHQPHSTSQPTAGVILIHKQHNKQRSLSEIQKKISLENDDEELFKQKYTNIEITDTDSYIIKENNLNEATVEYTISGSIVGISGGKLNLHSTASATQQSVPGNADEISLKGSENSKQQTVNPLKNKIEFIKDSSSVASSQAGGTVIVSCETATANTATAPPTTTPTTTSSSKSTSSIISTSIAAVKTKAFGLNTKHNESSGGNREKKVITNNYVLYDPTDNMKRNNKIEMETNKKVSSSASTSKLNVPLPPPPPPTPPASPSPPSSSTTPSSPSHMASDEGKIKPEFSSNLFKNIPVRPRKSGVPHMENYCLFDPSVDFFNEKEHRMRNLGVLMGPGSMAAGGTGAMLGSGGMSGYEKKKVEFNLGFDSEELIDDIVYDDQLVYDAPGEEYDNFDSHNYFVIDPDFLEDEPVIDIRDSIRNNLFNTSASSSSSGSSDYPAMMISAIETPTSTLGSTDENESSDSGQNTVDKFRSKMFPAKTEIKFKNKPLSSYRQTASGGAGSNNFLLKKPPQIDKLFRQSSLPNSPVRKTLMFSENDSSLVGAGVAGLRGGSCGNGNGVRNEIEEVELEDEQENEIQKRRNKVNFLPSSRCMILDPLKPSLSLPHLQNISNRIRNFNKIGANEQNCLVYNSSSVLHRPYQNHHYYPHPHHTKRKIRSARPLSNHSDADSGFLSPVTPDAPTEPRLNPSGVVLDQCDSIQGLIQVIKTFSLFIFSSFIIS